ncbi:histidine phosphatase family protein [Pelobium manganitolerans]|uniref:Histidine phosphatase family protein n=1 Tax=Pelobium manganitolerans TaxID=1842495 RepID=A0A419SAL7_9SPHI|nr:histidine phosphatase family protein [Pelobium manganitolerans]RKD19480.1 histidine phosphatase family protein [Pelobium manganitolerans]
MAKQILLIRHAKSDWSNGSNSDFNRPLNPRGLRDSVDMASRLNMQHLVPQKLVSSPALRAATTCQLMAQTWHRNLSEIQFEASIYEANVTALLDVINALDDEDDLVALFGHNNGITDLAVYLSDADLFNIPTCGVALIQFPFDSWAMVSKHTGNLLMYDFPKNEG